MDNTSTLIQSEEKQAPLNQKTKCIEVNISQCLSCTTTIEVPDDFEDYNNKDALKSFVREQIMLPSDCVENSGYWWCVDDFCVSI